MILNYLSMNGYGLYVWSSFIFTFNKLFCSIFCNKNSTKKEQEKFKAKYFDLTEEKTESVKKQETYKEILAFTNISKI